MHWRTSVGIAWRWVLSSGVGTGSSRRSWIIDARSLAHCNSKGETMAGALPRRPRMVDLSEPRDAILM
jgi:hypothetical protein